MTISSLVEALSADGVSALALAEALEVSPDTVERWRQGRTIPRPVQEGRLRRLAASRGLDAQTASASGGFAEEHLDAALRELREALHRRGRLSSRNEALDEVARLIFAHAASTRSGGPGISRQLLTGSDVGAAERLRQFVATQANQLPKSLSYEMSPDDFELQLKPTEDELAKEVVYAFERLNTGVTEAQLPVDEAVDLVNHAFGRFLADTFADEKELGQYLTPTEVVHFMVRLALSELTPAERDSLSNPATFNDFGLVLDPSCGVGSFLAEFVRQGHALVGSGKSGGDWSAAAARSLVVGVDKSERMIRLALANLATFGATEANLHLANGLARSGRDGDLLKEMEGQVGLILTNPPFGATFSQPEISAYKLSNEWPSRPPKSVDSELLFLERYIDWLRPGGQLLAVVPDSILTNKGLFADLRSGLGPNVEVRTVVSLPAVTFAAAGTSTKTSILHLRKGKAEGTAARFALCNDIGYSVSARGAQRRKVRESDGELPVILDELLTDSRTVVHEVPDFDESGRWDAAFHASLSADFMTRINNEPELLRISDVADLVADRTDPRRGTAETFDYIEISDVDGSSMSVSCKSVASGDAPSRARRGVKAGDVLVSTVRPDRGTVGVVPDWLDGAVCTTGFGVLRPNGIHPLVLAALIRSEFVTQQLLRNNVGIAYPAIEPSCLPEVVLPLSRSVVAQTSQVADALTQAQQELKRRTDDFTDTLSSLCGPL